jgi:hypothetical protein
VHLRQQGVKDSHSMPGLDEPPSKPGTDEARTAGDEDVFGHT